jgi:fumarate reductase flavoprotein subunit
VWIPGTEFPRVLVKRIKQCSNVSVIEHLMLTDVLVVDGQVAGACGVNILTGEFYVVKAKAVILCTGGAMRVYPHTTAPEELTGDGLAMAYRAGAELIDMEFPMFLPYTLIKPDSLNGVDFPYLLSAYVEAHAINRLGERYMVHWDPQRMEHSTRDVNSIAAMVEVLEGRGSPNNGTYLSLKHLPRNVLEYAADWFPANISNWRYGSFNMKAMETAPASHFWNGGVKINERCETCVPGLFAAGEGTGSIMGSNRVSGNALTMTQVWGHRAGRYAGEFAAQTETPDVPKAQMRAVRERLYSSLGRKSGADPVRVRRDLQDLAWRNVGVVRDGDGLRQAIERLGEMKRAVLPDLSVQNKSPSYNMEWLEALQLESMTTVLELVAKASLLREESRGALYRRDYPKTDNVNWLKNIVHRKGDSGAESATEDVDLKYFKPKAVVRDYGAKE